MSSFSDNLINDITLQYLTNKEFVNQTQKHLQAKTFKVKPKEKKFYKKRILALTKSLIYETEPEDPSMKLETLPPEIPNLLTGYVKKTIEYFKTLDKTDILQKEYDDISIPSIESKNINPDDKTTSEDTDKDFLKSMRYNTTNTLDNFVQKTIVSKEKSDYPRKKNVNLSDPSLKNKGLGKKKNIDTKYEEESQNTKQRDTKKKNKKDERRKKEQDSKENNQTPV